MNLYALCLLITSLTISYLSSIHVESRLSPLSTFFGGILDLRYKPVTINVDTKKAIDAEKSEPLQLTAEVRAATVLANTGQSIQTTNQRRKIATLTGGPLKYEYIFETFIYYWATNVSTGVTGTTVNGKGFPYGIRVLYINGKYFTFKEAVKHQDGIAELVFLYKICSTTNLAFNAVSKKIQKISKAGSFVYLPLITHIRAVPLKPPYFTYKGLFMDTKTGQKHNCSTVMLMNPDGYCITQHQFNQTFFNLANFEGGILTNTLEHISDYVQVVKDSSIAIPKLADNADDSSFLQ